MKMLQKVTRALTPRETKTLKKIRRTNEDVLTRGYKWPNVGLALVLAALCLYGATWTRYDLITFILGVSAVFSVGYVFFMPYEAYKDIKRANRMIRKVESVLKEGTVEVTPVVATRVALAKEQEDEGDLYIIELENAHILYIYDYDHNMRKGFPCLEFELYDEGFYNLIGRLINPVSEKIKPVEIDARAKWNYIRRSSAPVHLQIQKTNFDRLVEKMSSDGEKLTA